jgi:hypothetical protein
MGHAHGKKDKKRTKKSAELQEREVARQKGEPLPDREVMSTISPQFISPPPIDGGELPVDPIPHGTGTGGSNG